MAEFRDRFSELTSLGLGLAALSVDETKRSCALAAQLHLPFTLLCDSGREVVQTYGLFNEKEKGGIAYPATFVIDRDRTVRLRSLDRTAARVDLDGLFAFSSRRDCLDSADDSAAIEDRAPRPRMDPGHG